MDRVYIGSQELVLIDADKLRDGTKETADYIVCESCGAINGAAKRRCGECGKRLSSTAGETIASTNGRVDSSSHAWGAEDTRTARALDVIAGIASKAIAMGRFEEAERMLLPHLDTLLERALAHQPLSDSEKDDPDALFEGSDHLCVAVGSRAARHEMDRLGLPHSHGLRAAHGSRHHRSAAQPRADQQVLQSLATFARTCT